MPEYAAILILLLIVTIFLHKGYNIKIFKSKLHLFLVYAIFLAVGIAWDHYAIWRGHWSFGEKFLLGPKIGLMPIEEYGFGIVLSYFGLVIYKIIEKKTK